jgi:type II secretory pathway predicted ATPase ExeA
MEINKRHTEGEKEEEKKKQGLKEGDKQIAHDTHTHTLTLCRKRMDAFKLPINRQ